VDSIKRSKELSIIENFNSISLDELKRIALDVGNVYTNYLKASQMIAVPSATRLTE
jgi:hypothetical protein